MTQGKILLVGATGLVGAAAAKAIISAGHELHILSRRPVENAPKRANIIIASPEIWPGHIAEIQPDCAISCLGTTMRIAGSRQAFAHVDLDLVLLVAAAAKKAGARQFISVSSGHANASSSNFYLQTKGKAEQGIVELGFDRTDIMRPGLLRGDRGGPVRYAERIGLLFSPLADLLLQGPLREYRSIHANIVAAAIAKLIGEHDAGHFIHGNIAMHHLAH